MRFMKISWSRRPSSGAAASKRSRRASSAVITCIIVLTAHKPHAQSDRKTWFGLWRDDGFVKTKHKGRIDQDHRWPTIRDEWVSTFRNREVVAGHSIARAVTADDEWLAEAYLETDYAAITEADFEAVIREFAIFRLINEVEGTEP